MVLTKHFNRRIKRTWGFQGFSLMSWEGLGSEEKWSLVSDIFSLGLLV